MDGWGPSYAKAILHEINGKGIIKHLIYRDKTWFDPSGLHERLEATWRNMDYVLIIENTPDVFVSTHEWNHRS